MKGDNFSRRDSSKREEKNKEKEEDMLPELPDEIIVHILSFVHAKTAVQTSVLNKRYRNLWASLPVFNFDDSSFQDAMSFEVFVDNFLSCRDTSTNVFNVYLDCHYDVYNDHVVDSIIDHVIDTPSITTTIEVLTILAQYVVSNLPKLSVCTSLTTLKLSYIFIRTTNFDLPSLKHLYLCCCNFDCGWENLFDPFKGFVNLESLYFHSCIYYGDFNIFKISTPHLVDLNISCFRVAGKLEADCVFELQTPRLKYFKYTDSYVLYCFSTEINLLFVEKIYIDVGWLAKDSGSLYTLIKLFEIMQRAKSISLSYEIIEVLSMFSDKLKDQSSPFTRMQTFELKCDASSSSAMPQDIKKYLFGASC
ncbi:F-box/LRR-repeat protein [Vigna angularis]|uniref:F-box/LRR-repeat protein n=1 Tax=Phaseolus angularis TaxID=3914 RepID=A0A8T0K3P0_PHAAN|nr:F-box/LRR-repeat protein [Vigna angularis]